MRRDILLLITRQYLVTAFKTSALYLIIGVMLVLLLYTAYSGINNHDQNHFRTQHQEIARESWEGNPDKHPHRMAHFGTFAFRLKQPLSLFDFGIESYTGNAVFLEAHKQNTVNFSDAGFSTGLLRFGELHMGMVLQIILPLIVFFIGYNVIVADRENGTLKILLTQGASWKEILAGRFLGLFAISALFIIAFILTTLGLLLIESHTGLGALGRLMFIGMAYFLFAAILCIITIIVSATSRSSKNALLILLGFWLLMTVLIPRTSQAIGTYFYPSPTKMEFRTSIEEEVIKYGDSHNPNDPFFAAIKDSVLKVHQVSSVAELPFNYGGFIMGQGEKISSEIYNIQHDRLLDQYRKQNQFTRWLAIVNPYLAIKNLSMTLCGTDFETYVNFQNQAEKYRYELAQKMNELQMKYISPDRVSGSEGKVHVVKREEWQAMADFQHDFPSLGSALSNEALSIGVLIFWLFLAIWMMNKVSKRATAI